MLVMDGASLVSYQGKSPQLGANTLVAAGARLIGDLIAGDDCSFWFNVVVRGDCNYIRIGARTNVQDNTVIHVTHTTGPTHIGANVTIGHSAVIHACTIGDNSLIGMGAVILDGAVIPENSFVAAGALVTPGKKYPSGHLIKGSPAVAARPLTEQELDGIKSSVEHYLEYKSNYR